jgi:hypothetical protein
MDSVLEYRDPNVAIQKLTTSGTNDAAKERPFVSHRLWSVFFILQGMYGRTALLLTNSFKDRRFRNWRDDKGCDQLLRAILPGQTVDYVKALEVHGLQTAVDQLESQFLAEADMNKPSAS